MKKIIPLILLLSFSLPVMASPLYLKCDCTESSNGRAYQQVITLDADNHNVDGINANGECIPRDVNHPSWGCQKSFISESEFGLTSYDEKGSIEGVVTVSRLSGEYTIANENGERLGTGRCSQFAKKAF